MRRNVMLITGANGFLASKVVRQSYRDWQIVALVRPETSIPSNFHVTYQSINKLISDVAHVDVIMHFAACIPSSLDAAPAELISVNVNLVAKLIQAYPNARHVLASSVSVFGIPVSLPLSIDSPPHQPNAYGLSKLTAENLVCQTQHHAIIRFSSLIGVGMKFGSFIPTVVSAARMGKIHLIGSGERLQNYLDIDDAASMCLQAANSEKSFIALGIGERSYSNNDVAQFLKELTGASIVRTGEDHSPSYVYDFSESMNFGTQRISLKESLKIMVQQI